jgi:hypothetical protein
MFEDVLARYQAAVQMHWDVRRSQGRRQEETGRPDAGTRSEVTGGNHMDGIVALAHAIIRDAGCELPGYYRPEKKWDLLVMLDSQLVAAVEFKAQVGPSFGNNVNNRAEEAVGVAEDLWTAYREGRLGTGTLPPFLGYAFILEDCAAVHSPVSTRERNFKIDPVFRGASYSQRYEWLLRRLLLERKFQAACLTLSTNANPTTLTFPAADLSFFRFATQLEGHIRTFLETRRA